MKVLLVVNENPISVDLVRGVLSFRNTGTLQVRILFPLAVGVDRERPPISPLDLEWLTNRAESVAEKAADVLRAQRVHTEVVVRQGRTAVDIILQEADAFHADCIVLGQRLDEVVDGWVTDTTVQYVSNHAPCAVKVVPLEAWHGKI